MCFNTSHNATLNHILPTVLVQALPSRQVLRFLLDTGSNVNLITSQVAKKLRLTSKTHDTQNLPLSLNTVHTSTSIRTHRVNLNLLTTKSPISLAFLVVPEIQPIHGSNPNLKIRSKLLSDPFPRKWPINIDGILSAATTLQVAKNTLKPVRNHPGLYLWPTVFGNAIFGQTDNDQTWQLPVKSTFMSATERLSLITEKFISLYTLPEDTSKDDLTEQELHSMQLLNDTLVYSPEEKRFTCKLLFKKDAVPVNNYKNAVARLKNVWSLLAKDDKKRIAYKEAIQKLIDDKRVVRVSPHEQQTFKGPIMYLPHSIVHSPSSITTPYRVVYDGSAVLKTKPKVTYNDLLLPGLPLHRELTAILMKFRQKRYVLNGDIKALFLNVLLHKDHQNLCRFLWQDRVDGPILTYKFQALLFGLNCSPTIAMAAVQKLTKMVMSDPNSTDHDRMAAERLANDVYVDDLVTAFDDAKDMENCYNSINKILSMGSFEMRKWMSNDLRFMRKIPEKIRLPGIVDSNNKRTIPDPTVRSFETTQEDEPLSVKDEPSVVTFGTGELDPLQGTKACTKTLGYRYDIKNDLIVFDQYESLRETSGQVTMRTLASKLAKIFDPLGLISAFILPARILLSKCHDAGFTWTTPLPINGPIYKEFMQWLDKTKHLSKLKFNRHAPFNDKTHFAVCADACQDGVACTVHAISVINGKTVSNLLYAKSLLVHKNLRQREMAAKELSALEMASKVAKYFVQHLGIKKEKVTLHTDSMVTAFWIKKNSQELKPYIATRVRNIQNSGFLVKHIEGKENPSDIYSRGITDPRKLMDSFVLHGPKFFLRPLREWPVTQADRKNLDESAFLEGLRKGNVILSSNMLFISPISSNKTPHALIDYYSSYARLLRIIAFLYYVVDLFRKRTDEPFALSTIYRKKAEEYLIKNTQQQFFSTEIALLRKNLRIQRGSQLKRYNVFMDADGVLRSEGRMLRDDITGEQKMPIVLPASKHSFLLLKHIHEINRHATYNSILQIVTQKYLVLRLPSQIEKVIRGCVPCQRHNNRRHLEKMAPLPDCRLPQHTTESQAFTMVASDYSSAVRVRRFNLEPVHTALQQTPFNVRVKAKKKPGRPTNEERERSEEKSNNEENFSLAYIAVYLCLYSRAIHIELLPSESVNHQVLSLLRLIAARGAPKVLVTDSAANYKNAVHYINTFQAKWRQVLDVVGEKFEINHKTYVSLGGGSHQSPSEAYIKVVKHALMKSLRGNFLTFTQLYTLCKEIEISHNSRNISATTGKSPIGLQPIQLVLGRRFQPLLDLMPITLNHKNDFNIKWKEMNHIVEHFHQLWSALYLKFVQQRTKWTDPESRLLQPNQVLLVFDPKLRPYSFKLARVLQLLPSKDGKIRNLMLTYGDGKPPFKRATHATIPLAVNLFNEDLEALQKFQFETVQSNRKTLRLPPASTPSNKDDSTRHSVAPITPVADADVSDLSQLGVKRPRKKFLTPNKLHPRVKPNKRKHVTFSDKVVDSDNDLSMVNLHNPDRAGKLLTDLHDQENSNPPTKRTRLQTNSIKRVRYRI